MEFKYIVQLDKWERKAGIQLTHQAIGDKGSPTNYLPSPTSSVCTVYILCVYIYIVFFYYFSSVVVRHQLQVDLERPVVKVARGFTAPLAWTSVKT